MMTEQVVLQIVFEEWRQLAASEKAQVEEVDTLAFKTQPQEAAIAWVEWASPTALFLGKLDGRVVSIVGILKRVIKVGKESVRVAGVGGVATHPDFRCRGYARQLVDAAGAWIKQQSGCSFGLLFCSIEKLVYYGKSGWISVTNPLYIEQKGERLPLNSPKMVLPVGDAIWPMGEVDIQGKPW